MNFLAKLFRGSRSIQQRLFWRLGVLSLGSLSIVNLIWLPSSIKEIRQSQAELQQVAVRSVGDQIELFLDERERQLKSQAALFSAPFVENNQEAVRLLAHRFLQRDPAFEEIGIVDREGKERFRLSRKQVITDRELRDLSVTPFYQEGLRGKVSWGPVFTTETSEPWVTLAVPLQASETTTIGVVFGVLSLKSLWDLTGEFRLTYGGRAYVVEQTGRVIAAGDSSLVLRQLSFADRPLIRQLTHPASSAVYSLVQDVYINENKASVTATGLFLPGPRWVVVVEQSQALLYGPIEQKLWLSLGISLIGLLVSFGLARSLSSRLSGPIIRLREGVKLIGHGRLEHRVVVEGRDEVGELAMHFNAMAESLEEQEAARKQAEERTQRQLEHITALREISVSTTSTLDLDSVLKLLMEKIDILLPYTAALVWLVNRESGQVERAACWNLDEAEWKGRKLIGTPLLVKLAIEGKAPVVASNVQTDPRAGDREFFRRNRLVSYLGVPLLVRGDVLGVLSFLTREGHEFTEEEIEFLRTLSGQAAIAIQNAQLHEESKAQALELDRANSDLRRSLERIRALQEIEQAITSTLDLRNVLNLLLEKIEFLLPYSAATIRLFDKQSRLLEPVACRHLNEEEWRAEKWRAGHGTPNLVFETKAPLMIANVQTDPRVRDPEFFRKQGLVSYIGVPLIAKDEVLGVVSFYTKGEHEFSQEEIEFLGSVARQAAIAIHNSQLHEQAKSQAVELEKANKVKDEFLGFVSHELRTPVNAVVGYAAMIQDKLLGEINPEQEKALEKIISRSNDLLSMIGSILEATRIEAGAVKVESSEVNLGGFLDVLKSTYDAPLDKELTLNWDYRSDLPVVKTDSGKLSHILQNLINNAIKFTEKGSVKISARSRSDTKNVEFKVTDTGIGIPKESLPVIFEIFRQVNGSRDKSSSGVGLGLHIVKKFTELLGGMVDVESEPGKGSTFTVTIPYESLGAISGQLSGEQQIH